jgi:hypothetical protein
MPLIPHPLMAWELPASLTCPPNGLNSARCLAFLHGKYRIRTESLPAAVSVSGKRNFAAREAPFWPLLSRRGH